jgi:hypothetical protein
MKSINKVLLPSLVMPDGKYEDACALCGEGKTEKKWMGQYWHKKCVRAAKKQSKKML